MPFDQTQRSHIEDSPWLRAENKRLRMERDILRRATAFFANEKN
jgi:transposase-like protein